MSTPKLRPPFRVEHVGSLVRPKELYDQRVLLEQGKCAREDLFAAEDAAVAHVVKLQRDLGLGTITDGEMRRCVQRQSPNSPTPPLTSTQRGVLRGRVRQTGGNGISSAA